MSLNWENKLKFKDRNGADLKYGDKVLVKGCNRFAVAQIVGFTDNFVVLVYCVGCGQNFCRAPHNVVKVKDIETWKYL
jgi:hypothetical protein